MPNPARLKGNRREREARDLFRALGWEAYRVPNSGACEGFSGDLRVVRSAGTAGESYTVEIKARKAGAGFVQIEKWLGESDFLVLMRDRAEPLVLLPWRIFAEMVE